jgi:hypothetical protein
VVVTKIRTISCEDFIESYHFDIYNQFRIVIGYGYHSSQVNLVEQSHLPGEHDGKPERSEFRYHPKP